MKFFKQLERYRKLDELIKQEETGTPLELADELKISRTHLYRIIDFFKDHGADITYSRKSYTFYYNKPFDITALGIQGKSLGNDVMEIITGGSNLNKLPIFPNKTLSFSKKILPYFYM